MYKMPRGDEERRRSRHPRRRGRSSDGSGEETSRKRRVEKLSKKVVKHLKKHHVATEGYGTGDNRFQDPNLNERFIWGKKIEKQLESGASVRDLDARAERDRQRKRLEEIDKVKRSREEREAERARQQDELSLIDRARLAAEAASALEKEEEFLLQQKLASSRVRIEGERLHPIDCLVRVLLPEFCWGQTEPVYKILQKMNVEELNALMTEIKEFKELDCQEASHVEYWSCMEAICEHELKLVEKQEAQEEPLSAGFSQERQFYVEDDIKEMLTGKSLAELVQLEAEIRDLLRTSDSHDPDYWTRVLEHLELEKLKTKIRNVQSSVQKSAVQYKISPTEAQTAPQRELEDEAETTEESDMECDEVCPSPEPFTEYEGRDVIPEDADYDQIALLRQKVKQQYSESFKQQAKDAIKTLPMAAALSMQAAKGAPKAPSASQEQEDAEYRRMKSVAMSSMGSEEGYQLFSGEVELESHVYWWHEKYRPRKPKYFNRVHTGYEWNKYNQTHYDHDNPPPKVVQGYKFNIFYPDLIEKKTPPNYEIEEDPEAKDSATCWLRFKAGPPYEDMAFRIVNKEWEYSHKKGFKCTFERGILHLYFNFKRQRYRR